MLQPKSPLSFLSRSSPLPHRNPLSSRVSALRLFVALLCSAWLLCGFPAVWPSSGILLTVPAAHAADFSYVYDDLGGLIAVIDPTGETSVQTYDAVGNLLSISRYSSALVSIIDFTPKSGPVGTSVTIYGTGFRSTASENTVTFNGVAAPIISATATQVVAEVPTGATTGPITVTTPTGAATSSTVFTVTTSETAGAPTITGFTPTIGTSGTAVTISGIHFEPTPANNKVIFNRTHATVSAATTMSIATSVSVGATSGRISVATPLGKAVSSADFFIPPSPYTDTDVAFTGRIAFGESKTVTISTANKIALLVFDGTAGQQVSALLSNATIPGCWAARLALLKPDGSELAVTILCGSSTFLGSQTLPVTGTYTLVLDPYGAATGQATVTVTSP
jgi:YD repeat-containing protein